MPDDKKNVAKKLRKITDRLRRMFTSDTETAHADRLRLHVGTGMGRFDQLTGIAALCKIFSRQIKAQFKSHKLSPKKFFPVQPGQRVVWNDDWMQLMTMWLDAMVDEVEETRNWLNWKCWKKPTTVTENDIENARFELIDLFHFWLNAYYMLGGTPESLVVEYHAKRDENDERQKKGY